MATDSLILASQSPRRRDLLLSAGYAVTCHPSSVEELSVAENPRELVALNAKRKTMEVASRFPGRVVLGADTLVVLEGKIFGKPLHRVHAFEMIRALSGKTHEVMTGVCIMKFDGLRLCEFEERSYVKFRALDDDAIEKYLMRIDPLDKAGAYAAQDDNGEIIECIEGSLTNVIGLPMERVAEALALHFHAEIARLAAM